MVYKVKVVAASGSWWLSRNVFLGLEDITKDESKASLFYNELTLDNVRDFLRTGYFDITPLFVINHEV